MAKIFITHAWADNKEYNQKQLDFIRLLTLELEEKGLVVIYDDAVANKGTLNKFMIENIKDCDIILPICDDYYLKKSEDENSGVNFEINQITEHNLLEKVIPLKVTGKNLPYQFGSIQYESFCEEFEGTSLDISENLNSLFIRLADKLSKEELYPQDVLKEEVRSQLDSMSLMSNILNSNLKLSELYTYPELRLDGKEMRYLSAEQLLKDDDYLDKIFIVGDRQSGKTSFAKKLFLDIYSDGLQPIFLEKKDIDSQNIEKAVHKKYVSTYKTNHRNKAKNIVVIVDDFHTLSTKLQKNVKQIDKYAGVILFVDDIYNITSNDFTIPRFTIQPFKPTLRNELITKLIDSQPNYSCLTQNDKLKKIDESSTLVNISLGLNRGYRNGIIPAFPLYILIILGSSINFGNRFDTPISSYGHCYNLLIQLAFQNCGVSNDRIESYLNFLSYFSMYLFKTKALEVSSREFYSFTEDYQKDYKIFDLDEYIRLLIKTGLLKKNNSSNFSFCYEYLYYFFLGQYLSENFEEYHSDIRNIILNLDTEQNGHISIFLAHHCKDKRLIEMLNTSLENTFSDLSEATLDSKELGNFDKQVNELSNNIDYRIGNYDEKRKSELKHRNRYEEDPYPEIGEPDEIEEKETSRQNQVRSAVQTVEVIGVILKNRYGSIKNKDFNKILKNAVDANLRLLTSFIKVVSDQDFILLLEEFISQEVTSEHLDEAKLRKEIHDMLVSMNFVTIYALIMKTISSIGSEHISRYFSSEMIVDSNLTPSYRLIKIGLELEYEKQFSENAILEDRNNKNMSHVARTILNLMVVNHVSRHHFNYQEKSRIEKKFGFKPNSLLKREQQIKSIENR
ncbi:TIR domain-containing protein [Streptococcus cristatus]|uniref:TIR domain-containing protein n=1 Tax=Streptococcus cristatus TaxID=45634 RepID=UPI0022838C9B|nr:toll/interleukin-1 receptor domain-containing protein [Streptococcus cristatus]MCY7217660.1 toll/interleukin-1 receptor domain-containing protein [Streptococcus cristatus]